jgi:DNA-binding response OmpR family regulator
MRARVVIIEDDEALREILREFFENKGLEVLVAPEPLECPVYMRGEPCACPEGTVCGDVLITDLNMPRMTGIQFIERQTEQGCRGIIQNKAVMSGDFTGGDIDRLKTIGCQWFDKPFRLVELETWLESCLKRIDPERRLRDFMPPEPPAGE